MSMLWQSRKAADLGRDDRILVHSIITSRDGDLGEVKLRGRALPVSNLEQRRRYCEAVAALGWRPEEPHFHLFRIDIADVASGQTEPVVTLAPQVRSTRRATPVEVGVPEYTRICSPKIGSSGRSESA
jgi:hypothetical protein